LWNTEFTSQKFSFRKIDIINTYNFKSSNFISRQMRVLYNSTSPYTYNFYRLSTHIYEVKEFPSVKANTADIKTNMASINKSTVEPLVCCHSFNANPAIILNNTSINI